MNRFTTTPRENWQEKCEEVGLFHHTANDEPYWNEEAYYAFDMPLVLDIERATQELHDMCLEAVANVISERRYQEFHIPEHAIPLIESSWNALDGDGAPSIYGRFDLAVNNGAIKMLEYNADTPTSLMEASVAQWFWLKDKFPNADQFNSIHEKLIGTWKHLKPYLKGDILYIASMPDMEDISTVKYLEDTARQAGLKTQYLLVDDITWHDGLRRFMFDGEKGLEDIFSIFKLYPWEWMIWEAFSDQLVESHEHMDWIEPAWKMILSNKMILPVLWELFPGHPNLLPAYADPIFFSNVDEYVQKPLLSREGQNIKIISQWEAAETTGEYGEEGVIFQQYQRLPEYNGFRPVVGSWVIGGEAAGMGIRESTGPITDNMSRFVPHLIR